MPTMGLTKALGLDVDGKLSAGAKLPSLLPLFLKFKDLPLDQVPLANASAGLNLGQPIDVPAGGVGLKIDAAAGGRFALIGPKQSVIDEDDPFSEIEIKDNEIYLTLALSFSLGQESEAGIGATVLGFSTEQSFEIRCYRRFEKTATGFPSLAAAFALTTSSFLVPMRFDDVAALPNDAILVIRGIGTFTASANIAISLPTESLASVSPVGKLKFEAALGAQAALDASVTLTGGYQMRLRRRDLQRAELSVYTLKSRRTELGIAASFGISAKVASFEVGEKIIGALSNRPAVDIEEFKKALPGEDDREKAKRIDGFQEPIKDAISTKLQVSVQAKFDNLRSNEAAWSFEVETSATVSNPVKAAITAAFQGKFDDLTRDPKQLPPGIRQITNVLTDTSLRKLTIKINLLGLVNLVSVGQIAQVSTVERDANGDITLIVDTSSASRLRALLANFGHDRKRLRKLLSEDFLIEALYRANDVGALPPTFKATHTYFEIQDNARRQNMKDNLDVARMLGLMKPEDVRQTLAERKEFGRAEFYVQTVYTHDATRNAFLKPRGLPPTTDHYERIGRNALSALLMGDESQDFRKRLAEDDALWSEMKRVGNRAGFPPLFGLPPAAVDPRVEAAGADFTVITDWAAAMAAAGEVTREIGELLGAQPVALGDSRLTKARERLKTALSKVVKNTREEFGDPLGMMMFYLAAGENAEKTVIITGDQIQRIELKSR